jgi:hypothetical protein
MSGSGKAAREFDEVDWSYIRDLMATTLRAAPQSPHDFAPCQRN